MAHSLNVVLFFFATPCILFVGALLLLIDLIWQQFLAACLPPITIRCPIWLTRQNSLTLHAVFVFPGWVSQSITRVILSDYEDHAQAATFIIVRLMSDAFRQWISTVWTLWHTTMQCGISPHLILYSRVFVSLTFNICMYLWIYKRRKKLLKRRFNIRLIARYFSI